jgi:cytochrome c oxidase subunit 1
MGTLYKAKIRFEVPMLFVMAVFFNFLIGGLTGVFLSDVPVDVTVHGGFFVLSHFHYTIMGGLVFAFMAGVYYWMPKMTGKMMNKKLGLAHFWTMFVFFNLTFFPMFIIGLLGQPRRVFTYAKNLQGLNDFSSVSAFLLGLSFLIFLFNVFYSMWINPVKAPSNPWDSLGLEWQTASPIPPHNFDRIPVIISDPYHYSEEGAPPFADFGDDLLEPVSGSAPASTTASANEE